MVGRLRRALNLFGMDIRRRHDVRFNLVGLDFRFSREPTGIIGEIVPVEVEGVLLELFVENEADHVQAAHKLGSIYELEELRIIRRHFEGGVFVDVGANIGNHALYALRILNADRVIAIEPNPAAYKILQVNIGLNGVYDKFEHHAVGLADRAGRATFFTPPGNLGGTRLTLAESGAFEVTTGDAILKDRDVSFIKIDTEGLELQVLEGLRGTIAQNRPTMFVEVEEKNASAFHQMITGIGYEIVERFRRYPTEENFLVTRVR